MEEYFILLSNQKAYLFGKVICASVFVMETHYFTPFFKKAEHDTTAFLIVSNIKLSVGQLE